MNEQSSESWFGAVICLGVAGVLLGRVLAGGTDAPNFASDLGWMIAWALGGVGFIVSAVTHVRRSIARERENARRRGDARG